MRINTPKHPLTLLWVIVQVVAITLLFSKFGVGAGLLGIVCLINITDKQSN